MAKAVENEWIERGIRYSPLPSQDRFHASASRFKGFSGPIGSGKSQALCMEAIKLTYLNPGRTGLIGAPTYPMLKDATLATLTECLNEHNLPFELYKAENVIFMRDSKSKILLRAVDEFERLRGTNLAWFGIDELTYTQEGAWSRLEGRLRDRRAKRLCGFAAWTPKGFDWVYRKFIQAPDSGVDTVLARPYENRFLLDQVPDFYERLKGSYDETFFRQEVLGDYLNAKGGLVYQAFTRAANLRSVSLDESIPVFWAVDFNVDPMCSVVVQCAGGEYRVLDEIVLRRASTEQACEEFEKRFGLPGAGLVVFGDASGAAMKTSGFSDHEVIRKYFRSRAARVSYRIPSANPPVRERVTALNAKLRNAAGEVSLYVDPKCRELTADFEQVAYLEDSTQIDKDKDRKRTHLSDALGYLIWQESRGTVGERGTRLI
ncbi:MAG: terminase family protein [Acidobacteriota bacterium]|nr:terminase family protein [Acidobacteriota bacterium]